MNRFHRFPLLLSLLLPLAAAAFALETPKSPPLSDQDRTANLDRAKEAVKGLKSASGFVRRELGHRLKLRHVPELIFTATDSIEYSANISRILSSLDIQSGVPESEDEDDE